MDNEKQKRKEKKKSDENKEILYQEVAEHSVMVLENWKFTAMEYKVLLTTTTKMYVPEFSIYHFWKRHKYKYMFAIQKSYRNHSIVNLLPVNCKSNQIDFLKNAQDDPQILEIFFSDF